MGELHSMAYSSNSSLHSSSLSWDLQNIEVFNAATSLVMDESAQHVSPLLDQSDDFSTGYLEDALVEFSERSKRRRLLLFSDDIDDDQANHSCSKDYIMSYWNNNSNYNWGLSENFSCMSQIPSFNGVSDEHMSTSMSRISNEEPANFVPETKTPEEITSAIEAHDSSSSSVTNKTNSIFDQDTIVLSSSAGVDDEMKKKRVLKRVVYPFALVKPGGKVGDVTLNDINERILMPPTRPVRHPVGDFACRPCVSADGTGLSGKAVVALTRIHTQGRGTITIIRTKG